MNYYIAYCGLNCETCEARLATIKNDDELRDKVAKKWSKLNGVEITAKMINCVGCRMEGVKTPFCDTMCSIRQCAKAKNLETCGFCAIMADCQKVNEILKNNTDALRRLKDQSGQ